MGQTDPQKLVIPSVLAEAPRVQQLVMNAVEAAGFSDDARFAIRLALDEALSNAIRHGNGSDAKKKVSVEYAVSPQVVQITVCDEGRGFEPSSVPDPTKDEYIERPNGRGIMLIKAYMTRVFYNERGNCVTMIKDRNCPLPMRPQN